MLSAYVFLSLIVYTSWKFWILSNRAKKYSSTSHILIIEILYATLMVYFLATHNIAFLVIAMISAVAHGLFGFFVEVFKPEVRLSDSQVSEVMLNYWSFLTIDTAITLMSYLLMNAGR